MPRLTHRRLLIAGVSLTIILLALLVRACAGEPVDRPAAPSATVTVAVDGLDPDKAPDRTIEVPRAVVQQAAPRLHDRLQNESPPGAPARDIRAAQSASAEIAANEPALPTAGATQGYAGCRTSFVQNQSSRRGVRPQVQVLHYTVSPNRPGWSDVNAIVGLFNRPSFQASSHFVIDTEGNCAYIVPIEAKAWTQAAGNPFSVAYEIIATGREPRYLEPAGLRKLQSVVREVARRTGIPLRKGAVSGCVPTRTGIIDHTAWGSCGGGHADIGPFNVDAVVRALVTGGVTPTDRVTCRKLRWWRNAGRPTVGKTGEYAIRRRTALDKRGVTCTPSGPVKR